MKKMKTTLMVSMQNIGFSKKEQMEMDIKQKGKNQIL